MKMIRIFLPGILFYCSLIQCFASQPLSAEQAGYAGIGTTIKTSFSAFQNPALSAFTKNPVIGMGAENRFLIPELQSFLFQGTLALSSTAAIGAFGTRTGTKNAFENSLGIVYGQKLSDKFYCGIEIFHHVFKVNAGEYPPTGTWSSAIGVYTKPLSFLEIGACLWNPTNFRRELKQHPFHSPTLTIGSAWKISSGLILRTELEEKAKGSVSVISGFEYKPNDALSIRTGYRTNPGLPAFGFGLNLNKMKIDVACMTHLTLGLYPSISISREL